MRVRLSQKTRQRKQGRSRRIARVITIFLLVLTGIILILKFAVKLPFPDLWAWLLTLCTFIQAAPEGRHVIARWKKVDDDEVYPLIWKKLNDWMRPLFVRESVDPVCLIIYHPADGGRTAELIFNTTQKWLRSALLPPYPWSPDTEDFMHVTRMAFDQNTHRIIFVLSDTFLTHLNTKEEWIKELQRVAGINNTPDKESGLAVLASSSNHLQNLQGLNLLSLNNLNLREAENKLITRLSALGLQLKDDHHKKNDHHEDEDKTPLTSQSGSNSQKKAVWTIPATYPQNAYFTKRGSLNFLFSELGRGKKRYVIWGIPGCGKTALALEYAYEYGYYAKETYAKYRYVLWVDASISLGEGYKLLNENLREQKELPGKKGEDSKDEKTILKEWLETKEVTLDDDNDRWLLIVDKCKKEEIASLDFFLTSTLTRGHVLVTMDVDPGPIIPDTMKFQLVPMEKEEGALLLVRLVEKQPELDRHTISSHDWKAALEISREMSGLPLVITSAATYIVGKIHTYESYLQLYRKQSSAILEEHFDNRRSLPIVTVYRMILTEIKTQQKYADEVLLLCAFMSHEPIPRTVLSSLPSLAEQPIVLGAALEYLIAKSFIMRINGDRTKISLLHLIRTLIKQGINTSSAHKEELRMCAERAVNTISGAFSTALLQRSPDMSAYLPHIRECIKYIEEYNLISFNAVRLLYNTGCYLQEQSQYEQTGLMAYDLLRRALKMRKKLPAHEYPDLPLCLHTLAEFLRERSACTLPDRHFNVDVMRHKYREHKYARCLYQKALSLSGQPAANGVQQRMPDTISLKYIDKATLHNDLGRLYDDWGDYANAAIHFENALLERHNRRRTLQDRLNHAISLSNLAQVRIKACKDEQELAASYTDVQTQLEEALSILNKCLKDLNDREEDAYTRGFYEKRWGHYRAQCQGNLAALHTRLHKAEKYQEAEDYYMQAIDYVRQQAESYHDHIDLLILLNNLASLYHIRAKGTRRASEYRLAERKQYTDAIDYYKQYVSEKRPHLVFLAIKDGFDQWMENAPHEEDEYDYYQQLASKLAEALPPRLYLNEVR